MIIGWIIRGLRRLFAKQAGYYIGRNEVLPPPLSAEGGAPAESKAKRA